MKIARLSSLTLLAALVSLPAVSAPLTETQNQQIRNFAVGMEAIRVVAKSCPGWNHEMRAKVDPMIRSGTRGMVANGIPEKALASHAAEAQATMASLVENRGIDWVCAEFNEKIKQQVAEHSGR